MRTPALVVVAIVALVALWVQRSTAQNLPVEFSPRRGRGTARPLRVLRVSNSRPVPVVVHDYQTGERVLRAPVRSGRAVASNLLADEVAALRIGRAFVPLRDDGVDVVVGGVRVVVDRPRAQAPWRLRDRFALERLETGARAHVGRGNARADEVVLFVPGRGALMDSEAWVDRVEASGRRLVVLYYRGHTYANDLDEALDCAFPSATLDEALEDVRAALRRFAGKRVRLVGYSLGGLICALLLSRGGVAVRDLVLLCPFLCCRYNTGMPHPLCVWACAKFAPALAPRYHGVPVLKGPPVGRQSTYFQHHNNWSGLRSDARESRAPVALAVPFIAAFAVAMAELERSAGLSLPVLLFSSGSDTVVDDEGSAAVARGVFKNLTSVQLPHAGHWPVNGMLSASDATTALNSTLSFWDGRQNASGGPGC